MTLVRCLVTGVVAALAWGQEPTPVLRLLEPTADTIMTGPITFRIGLTGGNLRQVEFQVQGKEVCRAVAPPFECTWNAGNQVTPRTVRAVATLDNGRIVAVQVRTRGVTVSDRTQVDSVLISARVTDSRGRFAPGLTAADFRVLEDGVVQRVSLVDGGQGGAEVLVALDVSGSMAPAIDDLKVVVRDFLDRLRPADKVTLAGFNSAFFVLADRNADRAKRNLAIGDLAPSGGTAIYDTIISGAELVAAQPGRRAIVLFTDGEDMSSRATLESAQAALHAADTVLYLVATGKGHSDQALRRRLTDLVLETGGAAYFSGQLTDAAQYFREIVEDLSKQYLLVFSPVRPLGDGKWRRLTVELGKNRSGLRVRARSGYFATKRGS